VSFWGKRTIEENEYVELYEEGPWYVIEYKPFRNLPVVYRGETQTFLNIVVETAVLPNGEPVAVRARYPKDEFQGESFQVIYNTYLSWTNWIAKKLRELKTYKELLGGGGLV
jgi:hypothetical protein